MWGWLMAGLSGLIHISSAHGEKKCWSTIFKPLSMLFLMAILFTVGRGETQFVWVAGGLFLSFVANILSVLPKSKAKVSFSLLLFTFLFYSKGFWSLLQGDIAWWLPAFLFAGSVILLLLLLPKLDAIIFPVSVMGLTLVQMSWVASMVWMTNATLANLYACIACLLFIVTTLIGAVNDSRRLFKHSETWVMGVFFIAQSLIVASVIT